MTAEESIKIAGCHQHLLGWKNFFRGFISKKLAKAFNDSINPKKTKENHPNREIKITSIILNLHKKVWDDRNAFIHGRSITENRTRARQPVINQVI
jgi:hypothetical protein